ncbi:transporter substrate-binding domain-containing protein [Microbacterium sp.]|uniref:transporter substrate-binding domain-containing protein n=1 Tax=Microbacterium sp. TaxID=51671 RepID=UPI0037366148
MIRRRRVAGVASGALVLALAGCASIPADVDGTFDRVSAGGVLRIGVTANPPWTDTVDGEPSGSEVALIEDFAERHDADLRWTEGAERVLAEALRSGELDVAIGGFTDSAPWTAEAAFTDVYVEAVGPTGRMEGHVMLTRLGENRFLVELEEFLRAEVGP